MRDHLQRIDFHAKFLLNIRRQMNRRDGGATAIEEVGRLEVILAFKMRSPYFFQSRFNVHFIPLREGLCGEPQSAPSLFHPPETKSVGYVSL